MKSIINFIKRIFGFNNKAELPEVIKPVESNAPDILVGTITGVQNNIEYSMIIRAVGYVKQVVYSDEFRTEVLTVSFTSKNGLNNQEIYEKFTKSTITISVEMFNGSFMQNKVWKTQGLDNGSGTVFANRYFIKTAFDMASLILHEVAHQLEFHHESASEFTSVPYRMNEIFERVAKALDIK